MCAIRLLRAVAVVSIAATFASVAEGASEDEVSVTEYMTLPKFCWFQFSGGTVRDMNLGPESQVTNCGLI
jgi:hypothetical protein